MNSHQPRQDDEQESRSKQHVAEVEPCGYLKEFYDLGNRVIDTIRVGKRLVDPIDDFANFEETSFEFVKAKGKIYRKAKTYRRCKKKYVDIEYYQEFTNRIELASYKKYDDNFFTTKGSVYFWWVNSDGFLIVPVYGADPHTFKPFSDICGGVDKAGVYYGSPNHGVYKLDIPIQAKFEFIEKDNSFWNSPNHYVIVENKTFDIMFDLKKGYICKPVEKFNPQLTRP